MRAAQARLSPPFHHLAMIARGNDVGQVTRRLRTHHGIVRNTVGLNASGPRC
jgi:hypothetical protein